MTPIPLKRPWLLPPILFAALLVATAHGGEAAKKKHVKHAQGSRFTPVHLTGVQLKKLEEGQAKLVKPDDDGYLCWRLQATCGKCHQYKKISSGWHFNAPNPDAPAGRPGQPWFITHKDAATVIPVTYRKWPNTYQPADLGMKPWEFVLGFGHHLPGGGPGELTEVKDNNAIWHISGSLEVNCLVCHSADPTYDHISYYLEVATKNNFQWAPAAALSSTFAVKGSAKKVGLAYMPEMGPATPEEEENAPRVVYKKGLFNEKNEVFFNISRKPMNSRCYFCHSMRTVYRESLHKEEAHGRDFFKVDQDVHLQAGMKCVDCHRNGEDHDIRRGYEGEMGTELDPGLASLSCKGCHLGVSNSAGGRLGAPKPEHKGIPPHHFEKLTCTACHSGPYPENETNFVQTSQTHGLEFQGAHRKNDTAPLIVEPVYAKRPYDHKIGPQRMVWPSYWARETEGKIKPIRAETVVSKATSVFDAIVAERADDAGKKLLHKKKYLTEKRIAAVLEILNKDAANEGQAVYISGGRLYRRVNKDKLESCEHEAAKPVSWPIGHNVRPATQSLGAKGCLECHAQGAPFHFGTVNIPTLADLPSTPVQMYTFMKLDRQELEEWAWTYQFRSLFKIIGYAAGAIIALVLLAYGMYGVRGLSDWARRHLSPGGRGE